MTDKKIPKNYLHWVFTDHYFNNGRGIFKLIGAFYGIFQIIYATPLIMEEYYGGWIPLFPVILANLTMWGFLIGIILQPYGIYKKLKRMNWWERKDTNKF
tara:strand:+ start:84 stop:383 length:300 start_codon:yes stop_codon:yes gene_type:complete